MFFYVATPKIIRGDKGNENLNVAAIQRYSRPHGKCCMAGEKSFLNGKSVSNQV